MAKNLNIGTARETRTPWHIVFWLVT